MQSSIVFTDVQTFEKEYLQNSFPSAIFFEETFEKSIANIPKDTEIICCFIHSKITKDMCSNFPDLKLITTRSMGFDHIDANVKELGITLERVPEYGSNTVAEHAFALLFSLTRKIQISTLYQKFPELEHMSLTGIDLHGKTIGIVGLGKIGENVARIAKGIGMNILVYNRSQDTEKAKDLGFIYVSLEELLKNSHVITLHVPYNPQTHHILNAGNLSLCKKGSYLINTARGGLIETDALINALNNNIFAGIGLDVLEGEDDLRDEISFLTKSHNTEEYMKLIENHILVNHPKVIFTPHNAFNSIEAIQKILETTKVNIDSYLSGTLVNIC